MRCAFNAKQNRYLDTKPRNYSRRCIKKYMKKEERNSLRFNQIDAVIRKAIDEKIPVSRQLILDELRMSKNTLCRLIHEYTDTSSLSEYANSIRLEKACSLLVDSPQLTIEGIAVESGFGSSRQLGNVFKRYMGITATQYRKQHKK